MRLPPELCPDPAGGGLTAPPDPQLEKVGLHTNPSESIGVNRPAFGGTVAHFHQISRGPAKSADVPRIFENGIIIFSVAD